MQETRLAIAQAVDPLKNEMCDVRDRAAKLEQSGPGSSKPGKKTLNLLNALDPAKKRVSFIGFPENTSAEARVEAIESALDEFPGFAQTSMGHFPSGPRGAGKLPKASYAEFATDGIAQAFLKAAGGKGKTATSPAGVPTLKAADTKIQSRARLGAALCRRASASYVQGRGSGEH